MKRRDDERQKRKEKQREREKKDRKEATATSTASTDNKPRSRKYSDKESSEDKKQTKDGDNLVWAATFSLDNLFPKSLIFL